MCLLKLHKHRHENSIYFTRDNMVCFPKSGHNYIRVCDESKCLITCMFTHTCSLMKFCMRRSLDPHAKAKLFCFCEKQNNDHVCQVSMAILSLIIMMQKQDK